MVDFQIWNTSCERAYEPMVEEFYFGSHAIVVVYDITNRESFEQVDIHFSKIEKLNPYICTIALCGNKSDLEDERQVSYKEGKQLADCYGIQTFFETSAKEGTNITPLFTDLFKVHLESVKASKVSPKCIDQFKG
ncbi:unnamed protein product [Moneuplotes crassus]|uniref:Uncharacterized protein n=1 Tax=Euplotes crassus TaxID=5936 RepID=A0AAD1XU61_EUPCR|nr:unnamed protein product [Moneuplotes crassus]